MVIYMLAVTALTVSGNMIVALLQAFYMWEDELSGAKQMLGLNPQ